LFQPSLYKNQICFLDRRNHALLSLTTVLLSVTLAGQHAGPSKLSAQAKLTKITASPPHHHRQFLRRHIHYRQPSSDRLSKQPLLITHLAISFLRCAKAYTTQRPNTNRFLTHSTRVNTNNGHRSCPFAGAIMVGHFSPSSMKQFFVPFNQPGLSYRIVGLRAWVRGYYSSSLIP
jgi:hypothetical protein